MISFLKAHFKTYGWLWLLTVALGFAFPMREGLKPDAAVYATIARNVTQSGSWWPLRFADWQFNPFYEHPPGTLWFMALFMKLFGATYFSAALFSRLCALGASLLVVACFGLHFGSATPASNSNEKHLQRSALALLLLTTWGQWMKYAFSAQLEGPLALAAAALFYLTLKLSSMDGTSTLLERRRFTLLLLLTGFTGFMFKGFMFLSVLGAAGLWTILKRSRTAFFGTLSALAGSVLAIGFLFGLDRFHRTEFSRDYWLRQIFGKIQAQGESVEGGLHIDFAKLMERVLPPFGSEFRFAPLWSGFFWLACAGILVFDRKRLRSPITSLALLVWVIFMIPICLAAHQMPHWTSALYPLAAALLAANFPDRWLTTVHAALANKWMWKISVAIVLAMAILPYSRRSPWGRGIEWLDYRPLILAQTDVRNPLIYTTDDQALYMAFAYSAWYIDPSYPIRWITAKEALDAHCTGGLLWTGEYVGQLNEAPIRAQGWTPAFTQSPGQTLWQCLTPVR